MRSGAVFRRTLFRRTAQNGPQWLNSEHSPESVKDQQAAVRVESEITDWFRIGKGVRCLISPLSFNCYSEQVMRESVDEFTWIGVTMSGRTINNLQHADDIVLITTSQEALQRLVKS